MLKTLLLPLSFAYRGAIAARNAWYNSFRAASHDAGVPVVSVGNLTTGGTGKTPLTIEIVRRLVALGRRPGILTRGYAAAPGQIADEVQEYHEALPDVAVVVDANRVRGAATARRRYNVDCLVLDDGFQHRRLRRDLDVVLIDALDPWGGGALLPAGRLREPPQALRRASLIVLTRVNLSEPQSAGRIAERVRRLAPAAAIIESNLVADRLMSIDAAPRPPDALAGRPVMAVCGVGNPQSFMSLLGRHVAQLNAIRTFRDHHAYTAVDCAQIAAQARQCGAEWIVTTRKDWVKLMPLWRSLPDPSLPLLRLDVRMEIPVGRLLDDALRRIASPAAPAAPSAMDPA
ncbi:Tetraacyldisaccharide 4'-kinase [Phycisphaerae bacterium RAS1]|nr:Tetraacyldisaccharide 4'-kinase [Phycisphaerae bacterium RAS1]